MQGGTLEGGSFKLQDREMTRMVRQQDESNQMQLVGWIYGPADRGECRRGTAAIALATNPSPLFVNNTLKARLRDR